MSDYAKNRDRILARAAARATLNKRLYSKTRTAQRVAGRSRRSREYILRAIIAYGGKCVCCGEDRIDVLVISRMGGSDNKDGGYKAACESLKALREIGYPNGKYRLLCLNCSCSLGAYGYCPHKSPKVLDSTHPCRTKRYRIRLKKSFIESYGGKCAQCGESTHEFLTVDHVNGGGCVQRRKEGIGAGESFYRWLRDRGWPKGEYQLLCYNCNCSKGRLIRDVESVPDPLVPLA